MHSILTTPTFLAQAARAGLSEEEVLSIQVWLSENPLSGDLIKGAGGARKVRFARRGKGTSGGFRTIHYYGGEDAPLFLLALIDKARQADLSQAARNELARTLPRIAEAYRAGVKSKVTTLRRRS